MATAKAIGRSVSMFGEGKGGMDPETSGYLGPASLDKVVSAVNDDDVDEDEEEEAYRKANPDLIGGAWESPEGVASTEGPFSALTPSMRPDSIRIKEDQVKVLD